LRHQPLDAPAKRGIQVLRLEQAEEGSLGVEIGENDTAPDLGAVREANAHHAVALDEELRHFLAEVDPDPQLLVDLPEDAAEASGAAADVAERRRFPGLLVRSTDGRIAVAQRERVAT